MLQHPAKRPADKKVEREVSPTAWIVLSDNYGGFVSTPILDDDWSYWPKVCARLLVQGRHDYLAHHGVTEKEPLPWPEFQKQLVEAGENYWRDIFGHSPKKRRGRPSDLRRECWDYIYEVLHKRKNAGLLVMGRDGLPLVNGHPVTQYQLVKWIHQCKPKLADSVATKFARWWILAMVSQHAPQKITEQDRRFLKKWDPVLDMSIEQVLRWRSERERSPEKKYDHHGFIRLINAMVTKEWTTSEELVKVDALARD